MKRFDKQKKLDLLYYVESVAVIYYYKHKTVFELDAVSLEDLKQEAKIICLKMIKEWGKKDGKKNFDIKKFISRAVGWRMRDLLNGAIVQSKNNLRISDLRLPDETGDNTGYIPESLNYEYLANWDKDAFYNELDPKLLYGFNIKDIYKHFKGNDLIILKKMLDYMSTASILKKLGYKNNNSVKQAWETRIKPKLSKLLKNSLKELRPITI